MSEYIVGLDELGRDHIQEAGGKGALLGDLLSRGFPVPRGFCLTTFAYDDFLQISGLLDQVREAHAKPPGDEAKAAAEQIQARILEAAIPAQVAVMLSTLYRSLGQRPRVAIRPSPAYDDALQNPVAGLIDVHLNVTGEKDLFQAVRDTWAAVWQPRIIALFHHRGLDHARLRPAVIMQVMVHPVCSGTIFTADPVSGERDRLVITASWGMGQSSLGGQTTPDTYHVDRETRALRYKRIVTKEVMVSGSGIVPVPKNRRNTVVLKDSAIRDLCTMALGIEEIIQEPAEIEWCTVGTGGQIMVLEAMPIAAAEEWEGDEALAPAATAETPASGEESSQSNPGTEPEAGTAPVWPGDPGAASPASEETPA